MNKHQEEMLYFLRHATEKHPLDLRTAFDLGNEGNRTTLYKDYLELVRNGYIKSDKRGSWITKEGEAILKKIHKK